VPLRKQAIKPVPSAMLWDFLVPSLSLVDKLEVMIKIFRILMPQG
jgi:hypothetical protein